MNKGRRDYGFHAILSQTIEENVLQSVRQKLAFMQNSLELHQPNMHIGYRVIPLSVHIVSLARSILMVSDPPCCKLLIVAEFSDDE